MDIVYNKVLTQVINVVMGAAISYMAVIIRTKKRENTALKAGLQALLRDRIIQAYNHYVDNRGWIPIYALESINACYRSYEALGKNGVINGLVDKINALPNFPPHNNEKCKECIKNEETA